MSLWRRLAFVVTLEAALLWNRSLRPRFVATPALASPLPPSGILILWHEDMLLCLPAFARRGMRVLISRSQDGEIGARAAERVGYRAVRGSSSRGGAEALKSLAREVQETGGWVAFVADGPRGPRRALKPGAAWLAKTTGLPAYGVSAFAPGFNLNTWDRCRIPFPFAGIRLRMVPLDLSKTAVEAEVSMKENEAHLREFLSLAP